jgi:hypothetical protein
MLTKGLSSVGGVAIDSVSTNYFDGDQIVTQIGDRTRDGVTSYNTPTTGNYVYTTYTTPLLLKATCWISCWSRGLIIGLIKSVFIQYVKSDVRPVSN